MRPLRRLYAAGPASVGQRIQGTRLNWMRRFTTATAEPVVAEGPLRAGLISDDVATKPHLNSTHTIQHELISAERSSVLQSLREQAASGNMRAGDLIDWYINRVKDSRARLRQGNGSSLDAIALLIAYAARRRDASALRRLQHHTAESTRHQLEEASITLNELPYEVLTMRIKNALFSLAAQQCNWRGMYDIVRAVPKGSMSQFMCRAYLQAHSRYSRRPKPQENSGNRWRVWLAERFRDELASLATNEFNWPATRNIPSWLVDAALTHVSQSGRVTDTVHLVDTYLDTRYDKSAGLVTLERRRARLMEDESIPGHRLLNHILYACVNSGDAKRALECFHRYTHMPADGIETNPHFRIEPVNFSLILALTAMEKEATNTKQVEEMLSFLKHAEQCWGLYAARDSPKMVEQPDIPRQSLATPLLIDLRPLTIILRKALELESKYLVRAICRFQRGLLRRELRWHVSASSTKTLRDNRNEHTVSERWDAVLLRCVERGYISTAHRLSLRALSVAVARIHARRR